MLFLPGEMSCVSNIPAKHLTSRGTPRHLTRFKEVCPMMVDADAEEADVCCSEGQIDTLEQQLTASALLFYRCPSCLENFVALYCHVSPNFERVPD